MWPLKAQRCWSAALVHTVAVGEGGKQRVSGEIVPYDRRQTRVLFEFPDRRKGERRRTFHPIHVERRRFIPLRLVPSSEGLEDRGDQGEQITLVGWGQQSISLEGVAKRYKDYVNPSLARMLGMLGSGVEAKAAGSAVEDRTGRRYIDAVGGFGVFSVGHCHPKVIARVARQLKEMPLSSKVLYSEPLARLSELLALISPGDLRYSFICNSGAEAVEGALKLARAYTGKPKIIAAQNAFHGKTFGALSATGNEAYRKLFYPLLEGFSFVPFGDVAAIEESLDGDTAAGGCEF